MTVPPDPPASSPLEDLTRLRRPITIGDYRIIGTLGEGGMGTVYEAEQEQPQRRVALKVIRPDFVSAELIRRFTRESEVLGRLQHPGIAQIYEAGTADGPRGPQPFFAMELIKGRTLDAYAQDQSLTTKQRLELFIRVCEAVHYAHQKGVIHRDLKPANILVDATGQPKILDFGVARVTDVDVQVTRQTSIGQVIGTLQYMSPEQVIANPLDLDIRSDVYSLGVVLYELLSGKLPYDLARTLIHEAARIIAVVDPAPLSSINRNLRGDVETIVSKALEKEKSRRYGSAEELASDVRRYLSDQPISARPASAIYQLRKFATRNRALVGGLTVAAIILVIGTAVSLWQAVRATRAEHLADTRRAEAVAAGALAEQRRAETAAALVIADSARADALREKAAATASAERASREAEKAQAVNGFLQGMLASADPANARGKELTVREVLDQAATRQSTELAGEPEVRAAVDATIGRTYYALGLYDQARPHLDSAYAIRRRAAGPGAFATGQSAYDRGELASSTGDFALAEKRLVEGIHIARATRAPDDDWITRQLAALAHVRYSQGKSAEAEQLYKEALALTRKRHGSADPSVADRLRAYGNFLVYDSRPEQAEPLLKEALAIVRESYGDTHPQVVMALSSLGDAQVGRNELPEAEASFREGLLIARVLYAQDHPTTADLLARLGTAIGNQRRYEEAEPLTREALAMRSRVLGEQHPDVQLSRTDLARMLQRLQRYEEADTLLLQALAARRVALGDSSAAVASTLTDLGQGAEFRGDWSAAEKYYRESLPIWRAGKDADGEIYALAQLGWSLSKENRLSEADSILMIVLARRRAAYGANHWSVGDTYEKLAGVAVLRGDLPQAESLSVAGLEIRKVVWGPKSPQVADQLLNVAYMREKQNDTTGALPVLREAMAIYQTVRPPADPNVLLTQQWLGADLCTAGSTAEGVSLVRSAMDLAPLDSTRSLPWRVRGALGICLTRQQKFAEAEPLLLQAEAGLRAVPNVSPQHLQVAVVRLVELYRGWGKPDKEAEWRGKMAP
ncbi:MAG: serine/threonine-protein kinase [Gemmatimonadales bacterium]